MFARFEFLKALNSLIIEIEKAKILRDIIASLKEIYNILRYLIYLLILYVYFKRILFVLILFYKTRLLKLNLIIFSSPLNILNSLFSINSIALFVNSPSPLAFNLFFKSLKNFLDIINSFIKFF